MKLSEIKKCLNTSNAVNFQLPNGNLVPKHFHVTEVGIITKNFIDCGGKVRNEKIANFQLWNAGDINHRLKPEKLLKIIALSEKVLGMQDLEVEVEYQSDTIGKYGIEFMDGNFVLTTKHTDCLAKENCGVPEEKQRLELAGLGETKESCCSPGSGCC